MHPHTLNQTKCISQALIKLNEIRLWFIKRPVHFLVLPRSAGLIFFAAFSLFLLAAFSFPLGSSMRKFCLAVEDPEYEAQRRVSVCVRICVFIMSFLLYTQWKLLALPNFCMGYQKFPLVALWTTSNNPENLSPGVRSKPPLYQTPAIAISVE